LTYYVGDKAVEVFVEEAEYIMAETHSVELVRGEAPGGPRLRSTRSMAWRYGWVS